MKRVGWFIGLWFICLLVFANNVVAQSVVDRLSKAAEVLRSDPQMKHAILGLSVVKTATGEKVLEINAQTGLAPASCQKTITSAASMELLGPQYRYSTVLGYDGEIVDGVLNGNLYVVGNGDPSLGSWRFDSTKEEKVWTGWIKALKDAGIIKVNGDLVGIDSKWEKETLPGGWIWDDIGNYYGAGTSALNWRENQYDLVMSSGSEIGSKVSLVRAKPQPYLVSLEMDVRSAAKGTGDNTSIYLPPYALKGFVRGTIPVDEKAFAVSGSFPDPSLQLISTFAEKLNAAKLSPNRFFVSNDKKLPVLKTIYTQWSPTLDSLNYWFMKKSINLYGEAFAKTIAAEKTGLGSTDEGVKIIKQFWKEQGIESSALRIQDGSGLSPQNRVTTDALVSVLQFAKTRPWFPYYYDALPTYNQMKLKSGTIGGAKSFAGYHTAKDGTEYAVAMIINNYEGSAAEIVKKMFKLLDELK